MERMRDPIIRLLQRPDPEPAHVIHPMQLLRRARTKRRRAHPRVAQLLDHIRQYVLDRTERRVGKLQGPFDLEAVDGGQLGEDDDRADLPIAISAISDFFGEE